MHLVSGDTYFEDIYLFIDMKLSANLSQNTPPDRKDIPLPIKSQCQLSRLSSDESGVMEIGWDNNSPSPTSVLRSGIKMLKIGKIKRNRWFENNNK